MADEQLFALTASDVSRLRGLLNSAEGETGETLHRRRRRTMPGALRVIGLLTDPISATTALNTKPKVGTLNVYSFSSTWIDSTGQHRTLGKFIDFKNGQANIERKTDGKAISVPLSKLSTGDQKWIREELKRRKEESKKQKVPESVPAIAH